MVQPEGRGRTPLRNRRGLTAVSGVISELRRVRWPTRQETVRLSILVLVAYVILGVFLGLVDLGFARLASLVGA